jgi:hypothetical protein
MAFFTRYISGISQPRLNIWLLTADFVDHLVPIVRPTRFWSE